MLLVLDMVKSLLKKRSFEVCICILVSIFFAVSVAWSLWEQDIFWQIRAGYEIIEGHGLQKVDQWSYTAQGKPWINIQWLATVLFAIIHSVSGSAGLIAFRCTFAGLFCFIFLCQTFFLPSAKTKQGPVLFTALSVCLLWIVTAFKMEARSDSIVMTIFGLICLMGNSSFFINQPDKFFVVTLFFCVLSANFHTGTAPFCIVVSCLFLFSDGKISRGKILQSGALIATVLVTPYGWKSLDILNEHFNYWRVNKLANYDHAPWSLDQNIHIFGYAAHGWILFCIVSLIGFFRDFYLKINREEYLFPIFSFSVGLLFFYLSFDRMRTFPYHVLFFAIYFSNGYSVIEQKIVTHRRNLWVPWILVPSFLMFFVKHVSQFPKDYHIENSRIAWPVKSTEFILQNNLKPEIFHTYGFGGYFVWQLKEKYKTFADTRETMFRHLQDVVLGATRDPTYLAEVLKSTKSNVAVIHIPQAQYSEEAGFINVIENYFPTSDWAVVFFDEISLVIVKRIPEHEKMIKERELKLLLPYFPPGYYTFSKFSDDRKNAIFDFELKRCLVEQPELVFCRLAESARNRKRKDLEAIKASVKILEGLRSFGDSRVDFLVELGEAYKLVGDLERYKRIQNEIASLMGGEGRSVRRVNY